MIINGHLLLTNLQINLEFAIEEVKILIKIFIFKIILLVHEQETKHVFPNFCTGLISFLALFISSPVKHFDIQG